MPSHPFSRIRRTLQIGDGGSRRFAALAAAAVLTAALAVPAQADKPVGSATATQSWNGCTRTATYSWSGFQGRVTATVEFSRNGSLDETGFPGQHGRGGSVSYTVFGGAGSSFDYKAIGFLRDAKGQTIPGSYAESGVESHDCF